MENGVSDLGYLSHKGLMVAIIYAECGCGGGWGLGCIFRDAQKLVV